jgi:hypothetical protein
MTVTFLRFIKVFAIDQQFTPTDSGDTAAPATKTVSLLVKPAQAELVTLAQSMGKINLVMRSPKDSDIEGNSSADVQELVTGANANDTDDPALASGSPNGFLDFLQNKSKPAPAVAPTLVAAAPTEPTLPQSWRMVIWDGNTPRELEIQEDGRISDVTPGQQAPKSGEPAADELKDAAAPPADAGAANPTNTTTDNDQSAVEPTLTPPDGDAF